VVVLDGSEPDLFDRGWMLSADGLWCHVWNGGCDNVCLEDVHSGRLLRVAPMRSIEELKQRQVRGTPLSQLGMEAAYFCNGEQLLLHVPAPNVSQYRVHAAARTRAFQLQDCRGVVLDGLTIRH
jgi:hypothetical protein